MKSFVILATLVAYTLAAPYMEQWGQVHSQPAWSSRSTDQDLGPARTNLQGNQNAARTTLNQPTVRLNPRPQLHRDHMELNGLHDGIQVSLPGVHSHQNTPISLPESHRNFQKSINIASDAMDNIESGLGTNSDSTLHHSIKTAKEALRLVQQGFTNIGDLEPSATSADSVHTLKSIDEEKKRMNQWKQSMENIQNKNVISSIGKSDDAADVNKPNTLEQQKEKDETVIEIKNDQINAENQKKIEENVDVDKIQKIDNVKQELDIVANDKLESKTETKPIEQPAVDIKSTVSEIPSAPVDQVNVPSKIIENVPEKKSQQIEEPPAILKSSPMAAKEDNTEMAKMSQKRLKVEDLSEEDLYFNATKTENKEIQAKPDQTPKASTTMGAWTHHANPMARAMMSHNMRPHNLARSSYGVDSGLPHLGGLPSGGGRGSVIGVFPHGQHSNCAIPILLSCSPSVVPGSLSKYHNTGYGAPSYRNQDSNMRQAAMS